MTTERFAAGLPLAVAVALTVLPCAASAAVSAASVCAPATRLIRVARTDFAALRSLDMKPGACTLRASEYKCRWAFPGDAFSAADAQAAGLVQCAAAQTGSAPHKLKRGETSVALENDLSWIVAPPVIDDGQWVVALRIVAAPPAHN